MSLPDGLYQVTTSWMCAGFVIRGGWCDLERDCAPIIATKVGVLGRVRGESGGCRTTGRNHP